jgi:hypothetical protein
MVFGPARSGSAPARDIRNSSNSTLARATTVGFAPRLTAQERGRILSVRPTGSSVRRRRSAARLRIGKKEVGIPRGHARARLSADPFEICGRPQQLIRRQRRADAGGLEHVERGDADLGIVVIGERVVEEHARPRVARRARPRTRRQRASLESRQPPPAIDADEVLVDDRPAGCSTIQFDSGASRLPQTAALARSRARAPRADVP